MWGTTHCVGWCKIYPWHSLLNPNRVAAFEDIVQRNVVEIRKYGFNEGAENELEDVKVEWTGIQFWQIVKALSESKSVSDPSLYGMP